LWHIVLIFAGSLFALFMMFFEVERFAQQAAEEDEMDWD